MQNYSNLSCCSVIVQYVCNIPTDHCIIVQIMLLYLYTHYYIKYMPAAMCVHTKIY